MYLLWLTVFCLPLVGSMSGDVMWTEENAHGNFTDFDNRSLTCAARSFQAHEDLPYSYAFTTTFRISLTVFYIPTVLISICLNAMVIILVANYKKLHTRPFVLSLQILVLNLILTLVVLVLRPVSSIANEWLFGEEFCSLTGYVATAGAIIKALLMFAFSLDRILSVFWLYSYPKYSFKIMLALSVAAWVLPMAFFIIGFPGVLDCYGFVSETYMCLYFSECAIGCKISLTVIVAVTLVTGFFIPIVFYVFLYWKALQLSKAPTIAQFPEGVPKRDWKATIMFFSLFVIVSICTLPARIFSCVAPALPQEASQASYVVYALVVTVSTLSVALDPIVIMCHKDVRKILACKIYRGSRERPTQGTQETPQETGL